MYYSFDKILEFTVRNKSFWRFLFTIIITIPLVVNISYEVGPASPSCLELGTCDFFGDIFGSMLLPYQNSWGDFIYPAVWGLIIFIIWMRVENPFVPAIVGVGLALFAQNLFTEQGRIIGYALLAFAISSAIFQIVVLKPHYPSN